MTEAIRSWQCLNARCNAAFTAWEMNPACTKCGCVRVNWIPGGGHIGGTAKAADAELRALIDIYKLPDINSAERGRGAKKIATPPQVDQRSGPAMQFAPGFSAVAHPSQAVCVPSTSRVNFKTRLGTGAALGSGKLGLPSVQSGTAIEASHRPAR
jgi:hypothetical protein